MPDVNEEELREEIEKILKKADLSKISTKTVIQQLEETFNTELKDRKFARELIMDFVNSMDDDDDDDKDDDEDKKDEEDDSEEEEEKPKKPAKSAAASKKRKKARKSSSEEPEQDREDEGKKPKRKKAAPKAKKAGGKGGGGKKGKGGGGYTKTLKLSPALAALMGAEEMARHEVVKRMWAIVKEKQLYDPNNKHFAICDEPMYKVIGTKRFRIFGMMKYLESHFLPG